MSRKYIFFIVPILAGIFQIGSVRTPEASEEVPYPSGYRQWTHIKTGLAGPQSPTYKTRGGFHHIYANERAMAGYRTGTFSDGAVIVFDLLEMVEKNNGSIAEGPRKLIDVMVKDGQKYKSTGGWGFEEFKGDSETERALNDVGKNQCFGCHASQEKKGFVFSSFRK